MRFGRTERVEKGVRNPRAAACGNEKRFIDDSGPFKWFPGLLYPGRTRWAVYPIFFHRDYPGDLRERDRAGSFLCVIRGCSTVNGPRIDPGQKIWESVCECGGVAHRA